MSYLNFSKQPHFKKGMDLNMMKTYGPNKTFTRHTALGLIAVLSAVLATQDGFATEMTKAKVDNFSTHPNYHVRTAAWRALSDGVLPDDAKQARALFESLCPRIYSKVTHRKTQDHDAATRNRGLQKEANDHNAKEDILVAADVNYQVNYVPVPETFVPLASEEYPNVFGATNGLARQFLTRADILALI